MRNIIATRALFIVLFGTITLVAQSVSAFEFCWSGCPTLIVQGKPATGETSADGAINADYASRAYDKYSEFKLSKDHALGYSWVKFSLLDKDGGDVRSFERQPTTAQKIVDRSLLDWLKNIFRESKDTVLVSIDVSDKEGSLLGSRPLYAATYSDGFHSILSENDISLEGTIGFPRKSNEVHVVKLTVRYANSDEVSLEKLNTIIEAAGDLSEYLPDSTLGWMNEITLSAYDSAANKLEGLLGEFTSETKLSSEIEMSHKDGDIIGFKYYFKAEGERLLSSVVVWVSLEHVDSIFKHETLDSFENIMNVNVHLQGESETRLRQYIEGHDASRAAVDSLSQESVNIVGVCDAIRDVLSRRFNARDTALALNAYIGHERAKFEKHFRYSCFRADELKILDDENAPETGIVPVGVGVPVHLSYSQQVEVAKLLSEAGSKKLANDLRDAKVETFEVRTNASDNQFILINDEVGLLYGTPRKLQLLPRDLYLDLAKITTKFEKSLGCYSGDFLDTPEQPNVFGALTVFKKRPLEILIEFHAEQENPKTPTIERVSFSQPSPERLLRYRDGKASRKTSGCAGGFAPWDIVVASAVS